MSELLKTKIKWLVIISMLSLAMTFITAHELYCQNDYSVGGFIDEDGDGFNDLLPDSDGDGVPDGLDPDSNMGKPDSSYMHRYMHEFREQHQMMWDNMNGDMSGDWMNHGEPGMYGPGDSTMHGGHMGGGHHGGGMGGGMDDGGGMGPGGGMEGGGGMDHGGMGPDSEGGSSPPEAQNLLAKPANGETTPVVRDKTPADQNRQSESGNDRRSTVSPSDNNPGGE